LRLFIAVVPTNAVLDRVAAIPRPDVEGLRWTTREQWHVTLRFFGRVEDVGEVTAALAQARLPRCAARLGPEVGRFGRRVLHVPVAGLEDLAAEVVARTVGIGRPPEDRPFAAHLTLARARSRKGVDLRALTGERFEAEWRVEEICLIESRLDPHGARYETLRRIPTMEP
jgi:2'-5' RNA ligase